MPNFTIDQKKAIYTSGNNIIVSAGAGSGKTAVLSERILEKIKSGINIDSLLVLTFTEAAAFEMKSRIKDKVAKNPETSHKASEIDSAYITTFDSYALSIVKKYHYLLGIDKNVNIIDKSILDLYKKNTLDDIFEELYKSKNPFFLDLISNLCNKNDNSIKEQLLEIDKKLDLKLDKEEFFNTYENNYLNVSFIDKIYNDYEKYIFGLIKLSKEYYDLFINGLEEKTFDKVNNYYELFFESKTIEDIIYSLANKAPQIRNLDDDLKEYKETFKNIVDEVKNNVFTYSSKKTFLNNFINSKDWIKIIILILKELNKRVINYKYSNLFFDFSDIAKMSIKCLKENPKELEKLKNSLNEILLDEYQDTNDLQEEFISLIANHNVYMVGDIKQSIYRFRNANPSIFINKYETYKTDNSLAGIKIDLMKNFRSRQEVVDAINLIFSPLMSLNRGGADYEKDHIMYFGNDNYNRGGKVNNQSFSIECPSYVYNKENKNIINPLEVEIFFMAKDIINRINNKYQIMDKNSNISRPVSYKDFAILIDKSNNFELITKVFNYFKIPTEIIKNDDLSTNSLIHTFSNILNLIYLDSIKEYNHEYKLSYMSVARSFIMNMDDNLLASLFLNNDLSNSSLYKIINKLSLDLEVKSNSMLVEEIINEFDIINKLPLIGDIEQNLMRIEYIYNVANNYSNLSLNGYSFINKLKEVLDNNFKIEISKYSSSLDSVKILTIHKSKGLEYPIVYLPFLTSKFFFSENTSSFIYSSNYQLIIPFLNEEKSLLKHLHILNEKEESISEKIRLFYVALTRARDKLILIRQNPTTNNNLDDYNLSKVNSFNDLLNCIGEYLNDYTYELEIDKLEITDKYLFYKKEKEKIDRKNLIINHKFINIDSQEIESVHSSKEINDLIDTKTLENMQYGTKMHEIMESIDLNNPDFTNIEPWMIKHIKYFLSLDILKGIENANIYKEYEFSFIANKKYHGIIDLLIEFEDKILIIDYKLNDIDNEEYINQLSSYKEYIKSLNLKKEIHMYLFSFLEDKIKEI